MSKYYRGKRSRNIYAPGSHKPFKLSRSKIDLFRECARCFYVDRRLGVGRPPGFPFTLNIAVDELLKKEFDLHRAAGTKHPLMEHYGIDAIPIPHEDLDAWRRNFTGIQYLHEPTNLLVFGAIDELPPSKWRDLFSARFFGQLSACHYAVPKMPEGGVIMLCSGVADRTHVTEYAGGTALCGAVNALGRALAVELGPRGIRVNVLSPGFIVGTQIDFNLEGERVIDLVKGWIGSIPLGRPGSPEDMAEAAYFFATCEYASGQTIDVDGAWTAT